MGLFWAKYARRIFAIVSTTSIPNLAPASPTEATVDPPPRGPDWMPITPKTGSLFHADLHTKRGVEICYRLFDLGKSPTAVAYLMGMTLRSAERRQRSWIKAGGLQRVRAEVE